MGRCVHDEKGEEMLISYHRFENMNFVNGGAEKRDCVLAKSTWRNWLYNGMGSSRSVFARSEYSIFRPIGPALAARPDFSECLRLIPPESGLRPCGPA